MPGATLLALVTASCLLRPVEQSLVRTSWSAESLSAFAGRNGSLALHSGMRSVTAGMLWLKANLAWERQDAAATTELIELTVAADGRPLYFWLNGARMLAYDLPEWQLGDDPPAAVRDKVNADHARQAVAFLEKGRHRHGEDAALFIEMGNIHLRRTGDLEAAARCYRLAAESPDAPYYAARIHGRLLIELGRTEEALAWLRRTLPGLPADDPAAQREVVQARIAALERELEAR